MHIKKCIRKKRKVTKAICGILKEKKWMTLSEEYSTPCTAMEEKNRERKYCRLF